MYLFRSSSLIQEKVLSSKIIGKYRTQYVVQQNKMVQQRWKNNELQLLGFCKRNEIRTSDEMLY